MYIYIERARKWERDRERERERAQPRGVELSSERSNGCHSQKARLFEGIELSITVKWIYVNKTKNDTYVFKIPSLMLVSS